MLKFENKTKNFAILSRKLVFDRIQKEKRRKKMASKYHLTTIDNPFSPFTQFEDWFAFDVSNGYHSSSYLARIVNSSEEISQADEDLLVENAIDEIVRLNILGIYRKVTKEDFPITTIDLINNKKK